MSHITDIILGRNLELESVNEIKNVKALTLANAATLDQHPIRKQEFDAEKTATDNRITALETETASHCVYKTANGTFSDNGDGTYTAIIANPYNSTEVTFDVQIDAGSGVWEYLEGANYTRSITAANVELSTTSPSVGGHAVKLLMNGIVVA